jgi:hypothetical protein
LDRCRNSRHRHGRPSIPSSGGFSGCKSNPLEALGLLFFAQLDVLICGTRLATKGSLLGCNPQDAEGSPEEIMIDKPTALDILTRLMMILNEYEWHPEDRTGALEFEQAKQNARQFIYKAKQEAVRQQAIKRLMQPKQT